MASNDLDAVLQRLESLTPEAERRYLPELRKELEDDEYELDGSLWLSLEAGGERRFEWRCGWRYQPDEASEWTIYEDGDTPTEAATALLKLFE